MSAAPVTPGRGADDGLGRSSEPSIPGPACPDCGQSFATDKHLAHADTCPLGRGIDEMMAADARWFARNPHLTRRRRPVHWAEAAGFRMLGWFPPGGRVVGHVTVTQVAPGVRTRSFGEVMWLGKLGDDG